MAAQLTVRANFARHTRYFSRENAELLNHGVNDIGGAEELALQRAPIDIELNRFLQIALSHCADRASDLGGGTKEIIHESINGNLDLPPSRLRLVKTHALASFPLFAHYLSEALQLFGDVMVCADDVVEGVGDLPCEPSPVAWQTNRKITVTHGLKASQNQAELTGRDVGANGVVAVSLGFAFEDCASPQLRRWVGSLHADLLGKYTRGQSRNESGNAIGPSFLESVIYSPS